MEANINDIIPPNIRMIPDLDSEELNSPFSLDEVKTTIMAGISRKVPGEVTILAE